MKSKIAETLIASLGTLLFLLLIIPSNRFSITDLTQINLMNLQKEKNLSLP